MGGCCRVPDYIGGDPMNFFQQLEAANRKQSKQPEQPTPKVKKAKSNGRSGNPTPNHVKAIAAKKADAEERYRKVMGNRWMLTSAIEERMGYAQGSCTCFLRNRHAEGEILKRKIGPNKIEWKWNGRLVLPGEEKGTDK